MAKAPVVEEAQMRHAFKVAGVSGQTPSKGTSNDRAEPED